MVQMTKHLRLRQRIVTECVDSDQREKLDSLVARHLLHLKKQIAGRNGWGHGVAHDASCGLMYCLSAA